MAILKVMRKIPQELRPYVPEEKYHDPETLTNLVRYCFNPRKTAPDLIGGISVDPRYAIEQMEAVAFAYQKQFGLRAQHMELSFADNERISIANIKLVAFQAALYYGTNYQIIYAIHTDSRHRHIHFVMNTVSFIDGSKYVSTKGNYYAFVEHVKRVLWPYGLTVIAVNDKGM